MLRESEFVDYLAHSWGNSENHWYKIPKGNRCYTSLKNRGRFEVNSLSDCLSKYCWNGNDYSTNAQVLDALENKLLRALRKDNTPCIKEICVQILNWGGVKYKNNITGKWLDENTSNKCLGRKIVDALTLLSEPGKPLGRFDGHDLIMNSGITKIISLAANDTKLIIYDGRVGAALGDLAILAMQSHNFNALDAKLEFRWRNSRSYNKPNPRDPSRANVKLGTLFRGKYKHKAHAESMQYGSYVARKVAAKLSIPVREFEAALFMWGYDVRQRLGSLS